MDVPLLDDRPEATRSRSETGEGIVVGAIVSASPWFLTGWMHDVEVEFMIDTGCQVTILSTTVFDRMFTVDPRVRSELRPCRRRLVSANSSPLVVQGELELSVVFPGLCYLWWQILVQTDCWVRKPCSPASHISWICKTEQLWADGWSALQLHQQRLSAGSAPAGQ